MRGDCFELPYRVLPAVDGLAPIEIVEVGEGWGGLDCVLLAMWSPLKGTGPSRSGAKMDWFVLGEVSHPEYYLAGTTPRDNRNAAMDDAVDVYRDVTSSPSAFLNNVFLASKEVVKSFPTECILRQDSLHAFFTVEVEPAAWPDDEMEFSASGFYSWLLDARVESDRSRYVEVSFRSGRTVFSSYPESGATSRAGRVRGLSRRRGLSRDVTPLLVNRTEIEKHGVLHGAGCLMLAPDVYELVRQPLSQSWFEAFRLRVP